MAFINPINQPNDKLRSYEKMRDIYLMKGNTEEARRMQETINNMHTTMLNTQTYNLPITLSTTPFGSSVPAPSGSGTTAMKFNIGDKVKVAGMGDWVDGLTGIVRGNLPGRPTSLAVEFAEKDALNTDGHTCDGQVKNRHGYYVDERFLTPAGKKKAKFNKGDLVKCNGVWTGRHWADKETGEVVRSVSGIVHVKFDQALADQHGEDPIVSWSEQYLELVTPAPKPRAKIKFSSVIMEDGKRDQILEALEQINQGSLIFDKWGFGDVMEKGKGVSMLFWGPPGTGKTLAAQAIADHLKKKLKVVGTADVESSAPGESERNIRKIFAEAKKGNYVLLFDECDSLIYNRAQVGAILGAQINELLSQIERFEGVTLFTTNRLGILDEAMNRRLALKLEFGMPTFEQRVLIWKRMFPEKAPLEKDVNWLKLAKVEIAGGYIKNTVLRAARMAAIQKLPDSKKTITMDHLIKSLQLEAKSMLEFDEARKTEERPAVIRDYVQSKSLERTAGW